VNVPQDGSTINEGFYIIKPAAFRGRNNYMVNDLKFGFLHINLTNPQTYEEIAVTP
jgi:hypothetical protein